MRERLVRLTGGEKQSPDPPLQTCTPAAIQSQARAVNRSGASGMKQFVESSSIHGTLPGLSRGGSQTEFWFGSPRARWSVDASQAQAQPQPQARNGPPTKITVQYTLCSTHCAVSACRWQRRSPHLHLVRTLPSVPVPRVRARTCVEALGRGQHESRQFAWITRSCAHASFCDYNDARSMTLGAISAAPQ
jgi:hypothetical protein